MKYKNRIKTLFFVAAVLFSAFMSSCSDRQKNENNPKSSRAEDKSQEEALLAKVQRFAANSKADTGWCKSVIKKPSAVLYSIDLETAWVINNPILFIGTLENVATADNMNYQILVSDTYHSPQLKLQLLCQKQQIDSIMKIIKSDPEIVFGAKVAVSAKVTNIKYDLQPAKEGVETVFTGQGQCENIMYLGGEFNTALSNEDFL